MEFRLEKREQYDRDKSSRGLRGDTDCFAAAGTEAEGGNIHGIQTGGAEGPGAAGHTTSTTKKQRERTGRGGVFCFLFLFVFCFSSPL